MLKTLTPKRAVPLFLLFAIFSCARPSPARQQQIDFGGLEETIREELKATDTPGAAVAVIVGGRLAFAKAFGVSDVETRTPATPETLFRIASNTKMLTAAALVTLAEQGRVKLDDPVGAYVKGLSPAVSKVTLHQLLSHTSGIMDGASDYGLHDDAALGNSIRAWDDGYLFAAPGKIFSYSNLGYDLAGLVLEEVAGKPYADAMSDLVFKPLGMNRTTLRPTTAMTYPFSQGHIRTEGTGPSVVRPYPDKAEHLPSGGVFTSVMDYSRFVIAFMNGGKVDGRAVIPPGVVAKLSTPYAVNPSGNRRWNARAGYGLNILDYRGVRVLQHGGSVTGFGSLVRMAPEHQFSIIILTNRSGALLLKSFEKATESALRLAPEVKAPAKEPLPISEDEMSRYAGSYVNSPTYLSVEILKKGNELFLKQVGSSEMSRIIRIGENRFSADGEEFTLVPGADGAAEYLHIVGHAFKRVMSGK